MKYSANQLIRGYQIFISPLLRQVVGIGVQCRYEVTCSVYAQQMIQKHGIIHGLKKAVVRFLSCQPFHHKES